MYFTNCAYMQDPETACMSDLRNKAMQDCKKKDLKYTEIRTDIIHVAKNVMLT